jgi:hypothetical protein
MKNRGYIVTEEEQAEIITWVSDNFDRMHMMSGRRKDYKMLPTDSSLPPCIWKIKERLVKREYLHRYQTDPHFGDLITLIGNKKGYIHPHIDPNLDGLFHARFNVFLQIPPGVFRTYYGGYEVEAIERGYVLSRSGIDIHWTDVNTSPYHRIALSFGFLLPLEKLELLYKVPSFSASAYLAAKKKELVYHIKGSLEAAFGYIRPQIDHLLLTI